MLTVTEYTLKPHLSKAEVSRLMDEFGKRGAAEGEIANYLRVDGTGGYTIAESDDMKSAYETALAYSEYMSVSATPVQKIEDAVGSIAAYLGS
jgi:hypothetical protein